MTTTSLPWFRDLYEDILQYTGQSLYGDVLSAWIERARVAVADLNRFKVLAPLDRTDDAAQFSMWNLYALSRVNDLLLCSFQSTGEEERSAPVSWQEYKSFYGQIGFSLVATDTYAPFHHEIVRVQQADDEDAPIRMNKQLWPGLMLGDLLFSRGGVEVVGGRNHIVKEIAETATLYFTFRRQHRKTSDLSMGWGSNSQWRTSFRRDYESKDARIYNADGKHLLNAERLSRAVRDGLSVEERIELCKHRCFIVTAADDQELWPFDDRLEESRQ